MSSPFSTANSTVVIGFEEVLYTVEESAGVVRVSVAVFEGGEVFTSGGMDSVQIRFNTQSGSAIGNSYIPVTVIMQNKILKHRHVFNCMGPTIHNLLPYTTHVQRKSISTRSY